MCNLYYRKQKIKTWKTKEYGDVAYISRREFEKKYSREKGGYTVIGAVGKGLKRKSGTVIIDGTELLYYKLEYSKLSYCIDGYIPINEAECLYLAVVRNCIAKRLLHLFGIVITVILTLCIVLHVLNRTGPKLDDGIKKYDVPFKMNENIDSDRISIPGYSNLTVLAETDVSYVALWNPDRNPCYFQFKIVMTETGRELYKSDMIPPGYAVTEVKLNKKLKKGIYPITIQIETYNLKNYKEKMNGGEVKTNLVSIENSSKGVDAR